MALPRGEELAEAVAAALHEPIETVRPAVLIGSVTLDAAFASEDELAAAIEAERVRVRDARGPIKAARMIDAASLDALLAEADRLDSAGRLDLESVVAIQRTVGAVAARQQERLVLILARYGTTRRLLWSRAVDAMRDGRLSADDLGDARAPDPALERAHVARRHRRVPDRRARDPGPRRRRAPGRPRGAPGGRSPRTRSPPPAFDGSPAGSGWTRNGSTGSSPSPSTPRPTRRPSSRASTRPTSRRSPVASATSPGRPRRARRAPAPGSGCRPSCRCATGSR